MREIKFKIWYPDSRLMEGPFDIDLFYIKNSAHPKFVSSDTHYYLQYTGLKDKNGREIYEGDIVKGGKNIGNHRYWHGLYTVNFGHYGYDCDYDYIINGSGFYLKLMKPDYEQDFLHEIILHIEDVEIIGNIYENAGLLNANE
jgi:uncharacterized phage protein (TIGR01671 family)